MTRAALYLRKSTDEQADSIDTQRANAERWAAARGWTITAEFVDSGISRTEFAPERRRGWFAMLAAAGRHGFDAVITRDTSRIGGTIGRALVLVEDLLETQIKLFCYVDGREITGSNALECVTLALQFFGAQGEVEAIRARTREALATKARAGKVAGGVTYGYRNVDAPDGTGRAREVLPEQAAVVREIFERYAAGQGLRTIAAGLNSRGVPSPRAGRRGLGTWVPSVIHAMLRRPLYVGRLEWGHVAKVTVGGTRTRTERHAHELVVRDAPELRIVGPDLWASVAARIGEAPTRRSPGPPPRHMLSGLLHCAGCGGPLGVGNTRQGDETVRVYVCQHRRDRGRASCPAPARRRTELVEGVVVRWLLDDVLTAARVDRIVVALRARLLEMRAQRTGDTAALEREARRLSVQIGNLTETLADARIEARASIVDGIAERQAKRARLDEQIAAARVTPVDTRSALERVEAAVRARLGSLRELLGERSAKARALLAKLLPDGLVVRREERGVTLLGTASVGNALSANWASPAGFETLPLGPEDGRVEGRLAA